MWKLFANKSNNSVSSVGDSKIDMIKILREGTGLGLKESKEIVDRLDARGELNKSRILDLCEAKRKNIKTFNCSDYEWLVTLIETNTYTNQDNSMNFY